MQHVAGLDRRGLARSVAVVEHVDVLADATGIIVAHRASTVLIADRVALLDGGTITHVGTHSELMASVPAYHELLAAEAANDPTVFDDLRDSELTGPANR